MSDYGMCPTFISARSCPSLWRPARAVSNNFYDAILKGTTAPAGEATTTRLRPARFATYTQGRLFRQLEASNALKYDSTDRLRLKDLERVRLWGYYPTGAPLAHN